MYIETFGPSSLFLVLLVPSLVFRTLCRFFVFTLLPATYLDSEKQTLAPLAVRLLSLCLFKLLLTQTQSKFNVSTLGRVWSESWSHSLSLTNNKHKLQHKPSNLTDYISSTISRDISHWHVLPCPAMLALLQREYLLYLQPSLLPPHQIHHFLATDHETTTKLIPYCFRQCSAKISASGIWWSNFQQAHLLSQQYLFLSTPVLHRLGN